MRVYKYGFVVLDSRIVFRIIFESNSALFHVYIGSSINPGFLRILGSYANLLLRLGFT